MRKELIALALLCCAGLPVEYTSCLDNITAQQNFSVIVNNNHTNVSITTACQYGCDGATGKCRTFDSGYGMIVVLVSIFFTIAMFWLSHYFKHKNEDEFDLPKAGFGMLFLFLGILGLFGVMLFVGTMVTGYDSSFLAMASDWMLALSNIWGIVIGAFVIIMIVLFLMSIVKERLIDRRE